MCRFHRLFFNPEFYKGCSRSKRSKPRDKPNEIPRIMQDTIVCMLSNWLKHVNHNEVGVASSQSGQSVAEHRRRHPVHWCKTHYHTQIIFTHQPDIINTHIQTHVSPHKLITTSTCAFAVANCCPIARPLKRPGANVEDSRIPPIIHPLHYWRHFVPLLLMKYG